MKCFLRLMMLMMAFVAALLPTALATTMVATQLKCALCNETSEQTVLKSSSRFGSSDLDGRPPERLRSTMDAWVHECPSCGYCSYSLDERIDGAEKAIKDPAYIEILRDESMDALARRFLCLSKIYDAAGDNNNALEFALYATWALDDADDRAKAAVIRETALAKIDALIQSGQRFRDQTAADQLLASDIARRIGDFAKAAVYANAGLELKPDADIEKILRYELALIAKSDAQVHEIAEALESPQTDGQAAEPREEGPAASAPKDGESSGGEDENEATSNISPERMAQINAKSAKLQAAGEAFKKARIMRGYRSWDGARAQYQQIIRDNPGSFYAATAEKELAELVRQAQLDEVEKTMNEAQSAKESADDSAFMSNFSGVYLFTSHNDDFMRRTTLDLRSNSDAVFEERDDYPEQTPVVDTSNARRAAHWEVGYSGKGKWGRGENGKLTIAFLLYSTDGRMLRGLLSFDVEPNGDLLSLPESLKNSNGDAVDAAREYVPDAFVDQIRLVKQK